MTMRRALAILSVLALTAGCGGSAPDRPPFTRSGSGNTVFDLPDGVDRVQITGTYTGSCQNFIVWNNTALVVNTILGTCDNASGQRYDGVHATSEGEVRIEGSEGVAWTFTEVR